MVVASGSSQRPAKVQTFKWSFLRAPSFARALHDHFVHPDRELRLLYGSALVARPRDRRLPLRVKFGRHARDPDDVPPRRVTLRFLTLPPRQCGWLGGLSIRCNCSATAYRDHE